MRFAQIDWSSEVTWLLILVILILLIVGVALDRVAPKKAKHRRRRVDQVSETRRSDLID